MRIDAKHIQFTEGLPVVQGELQKIGEDWTPLCMVCGEHLEIVGPIRETLLAKVNVSSPVITCPKCNTPHLVAHGEKAMVMGPVGSPSPARPKGLVLALCVTPGSLEADAVSGVLGDPLKVSMGDTKVLQPGDYLAMADSEPVKPIRLPGKGGYCCTCNTLTEQHCPDCTRPLCMKTGCEASHVIPCPPKKRDSYI